MLALVVDVGSFYSTKAWLQGIADVAVLSSVTTIDAAFPLGHQDQHVRDIIAQTALANGLEANLFKVTTTSDDNDLTTVTIRAIYIAPAFFMPALGFGDVSIGIYARVEIAPGQTALSRRAHLTD